MHEKFKINVTSNYLGNFYTTFVGVFTLPIYLEYLGVEAYGLLGFFTMLMAFIMLLDMGFSATFLREVPYLKEEKIDGYKICKVSRFKLLFTHPLMNHGLIMECTRNKISWAKNKVKSDCALGIIQ